MKGYIILFSPTGGTEKVAHILSQEMKTAGFLDETVKVDLCDRNFDFKSVDIKAEDFALIAVPSYGGRVPALAAERLALVKGNGARWYVFTETEILTIHLSNCRILHISAALCRLQVFQLWPSIP